MITLNLLPADRKHRAEVSAEEARWLPAMLTVALVAVLLAGGSFFLGSLLTVRQESLDAQLQSLQTTGQRKLSDIVNQTTKLNTSINLLSTKIGTVRSWSSDLASVINLLPADITVTALNLTSTGQLRLEGVAKTRLSFLSLQTALTNTPLLKNVTTKSTASKRENVPFVYTAQLP